MACGHLPMNYHGTVAFVILCVREHRFWATRTGCAASC